MDIVYFGIIVFLFILAVFDLMVGVSYDAVNFLGPAVGAKAANVKYIFAVAAVGVMFGAAVSNGMMEIARNGIFSPEHYYFQEVICICMAVMVTDVIILDVFNSLGLPTSTTVSMVFELLGGAFAIAIVKILTSADDALTFGMLLNTDKALSVILGIFLSVAVAFFFGSVVQWIVRLIFTFDYHRHLKWSIGLFGGIAATAIIYFMLIKGMKESSLMTDDMKAWLHENASMLMVGCLVGFTVLMQVLHWLRVNVFRVIVVLGTFALAMAFAGNDLVNFIGVPLAGYSSYVDYMANGAGSDTFLMESLNAPAKTPFIFLFCAGVIMIISLYTSKKARNVIKTSVDLSRQAAGEEMFGSSGVARSIVRTSMSVATFVTNVTPAPVKRWINSRFDSDKAVITDGAAFDMVRASVQLLLASLLIALGTSLKLPLSTTYVTFMVAMGTSLADRAWGRESAVFRITGVLSVIGGWFITAGAAFTACFFVALLMYYGGVPVMVVSMGVVVFMLLRSNVLFNRKKETESEDTLFAEIVNAKDTAGVWPMVKEHVCRSSVGMLNYSSEEYRRITDAFIAEDHRAFQRIAREINDRKKLLRQTHRKETICIRRVDSRTAIEKTTWFHLQSNAQEQLHYIIKRLCDMCREHVDNNFTPLPAACAAELVPVRNKVCSLIAEGAAILENGSEGIARLVERSDEVKKRLDALYDLQVKRINAGDENLTVSLVYLNILQESSEMLSSLDRMIYYSERFRN